MCRATLLIIYNNNNIITLLGICNNNIITKNRWSYYFAYCRTSFATFLVSKRKDCTKNALDLMCVPTMLLGKRYLRLAKGPTIADNGETDVERNNNVCHLLTRGDWLSIKPLHCKKGGAGGIQSENRSIH